MPSENSAGERSPEIQKMGVFLGNIVRVATASAKIEFVSGLSCRKKPNHSRCPGHLSIIREDIPEPFIYWHCTHCEDGGRISDWKATWMDLSRWKSQIEPEADEKIVDVVISQSEFNELIGEGDGSYDPDSEKIICSAKWAGNGINRLLKNPRLRLGFSVRPLQFC